MDDEMLLKIARFVADTQEGLFGTKAKLELEKAQNYSNVIAYFLGFINELYNPPEEDKELYGIGQAITRCILILYRDSKSKDEKVAKALYLSLFNNFPNTQNTNVFDRYRILLEAAISFKNSISLKDRIVLWTVSKSLFEAYNEFLNGLLGYVNICTKAAIGQKYNPNVLHNSYKAKLDEFRSLNLDFFFPLILNIAKHEIRNAITHSRISPNNENDEIEYTVKTGNTFENKKIDLFEFVAIASAGTYIPIGYMAALSTIFVIENGSIPDFSLLPQDIKEIFHNMFNITNTQ